MKKLRRAYFSLLLVLLLGVSKIQSRCYWTRYFHESLPTCHEIVSVKCDNVTTPGLYEFINNVVQSVSRAKACFELIISNSNISVVGNQTFNLNISKSVVLFELINNRVDIAENEEFLTFPNLTDFMVINSKIKTTKFLQNHGKLQKLVLNYNNISQLQESDFVNLQYLSKLDLSYNNLQVINNFTFNLPKLKELYASNNSIGVLEPRIFENNQQLVTLKLTSNKLRLISNNTFSNLKKLEQLYLDDNLLDGLEDGTFQNLKSLWLLYLSNNKLEIISKNMFAGLAMLNSLHLENNRIKTITPESLSNFGRLSYINLRGNDIKTVENGTFKGVTNLKSLNLTNLNIEKIQPGAFNGMSELTILDVGNNKLRILETNTFLGLHNLRNLLLTENAITAVKQNAFQGLTSLKNLNIRGNNISALETDMFNGLDSLTSLEIIDLNIKEIQPGAFNGLSNLDTLVVGNLRGQKLMENQSNAIEFKNSSFQGLSELKTLHVKNFYITTIDADTFESIKGVHQITFENCSIERLNHGIFANLNNLWLIKSFWNENKFLVSSTGYWYDFGNLSIKSIEPETLSDLFTKKHFFRRNNLYLNNNRLHVLQSNTFSEISNMVELAVDNNQIDTIEPGAFNGLSFHTDPYSVRISTQNNIKYASSKLCNTLYLNNNKLKVLRNYTFDNIIDLVGLKLDHNNIEEVEAGAFIGLNFNIDGFYVGNGSGCFNSLQLNDNRMKILRSNTFGKITNLVTLKLDNNAIEKIEPYTFNGFSFQSKVCVDIQTNYAETDYNTLYLNNNKLTVISNNTFNGINYIVGLRLDNNNITKIEPGAFKGLSFSASLCYYHEQFRSISLRNYTTRYNILYLNTNKLNTVAKDTFVGTKGLTVLRLDDNSINRIEPGAFSTVDELIILKLNNNEMEILEADVFKNLVELQILDLSNNKIFKITTESFSGLTNLQDLLLYSNKITEVPLGTLKNFVSLENLQLGNNNLSAFRTGSFSNMENLKYLNFSHNNLSTLSESVFYPLKGLQVLDLDDNNLSYINYTSLLLHLPYLRFISVNNNDWVCAFLINMVKTFKATGINYLFNSTSQYTEENVDGIFCAEITDEEASTSASDEDKTGIEDYKAWMREVSGALAKIKKNQDSIKLTNASLNMISILNKMNSKFDKLTSLQQPVEELNNWVTSFAQNLERLKQSNFNKTLNYEEIIAQNVSSLGSDRTLNLNPLLTMLILLLCVLCLTIFLILVIKTCTVHFRKMKRRFNRTASHMELIDTSA